MPSDLTLRYLRALADLPHERPRALADLEACFRAAETPQPLDGPMSGRVLTTTLGYRLDPIVIGLARLWMPWQGKTFDDGRDEGRNLFSLGARRLLRVTLPGYHDVRDEGARCSAFRFLTSSGPSALSPGVDVLRIDYRSVVENPGWPVRQVLDELVAVDDGLYLGQALLHWRGAMRRAAWFSLER